MRKLQEVLLVSIVILIEIGLYFAFESFFVIEIFAGLFFLVATGLVLRRELPKRWQKKRRQKVRHFDRVKVIDLRENGEQNEALKIVGLGIPNAVVASRRG